MSFDRFAELDDFYRKIGRKISELGFRHNLSTFFINNGIYGMTGGQMAPTTLIGQRSTTSVEGRTREQAGMPLRICELLATLDGPAYIERVSLDTPAHIRAAKKAVRKAFEYDDYRYQKENGILIKEKYRAEGLHKVLYQCPHCMTEGKMVGKGIHLEGQPQNYYPRRECH